MKKKKKHWYLFTLTECPLCGRSHKGKVRKYTRKPKDPNKRYEYRQIYDWCDV